MLKTRTVLLIVLFMLCCYTTSFGNIKNFSVETHYVSRFIWRGFDIIPDNNSALQPSVLYSAGSTGLWFNIWGSVSLTERSNTKTADEVDYVFGYDRPLAGGAVTASVGMYYYTFPNLEGNNATPEVFVGLTFGKIPLSPSFFFYHDFDLADGQYFLCSLSQSIKPVPLTFNLSAGYNNNYLIDDSGISDVTLSCSYTITAGRLNIIPRLYYALTPMDTVNDNDSEIWFSVGIAF